MEVYQLTQNHVSSDLEGEYVILDHKAGKYFGLNETGSLVWEMLRESPAGFGALKNGILAAFNVDDTTCTEDLENLLSELMHENLVEKI